MRARKTSFIPPMTRLRTQGLLAFVSRPSNRSVASSSRAASVRVPPLGDAEIRQLCKQARQQKSLGHVARDLDSFTQCLVRFGWLVAGALDSCELEGNLRKDSVAASFPGEIGSVSK